MFFRCRTKAPLARLITLLVLIGLGGAAAAATLTVGTTAGMVGDTVDVPVTLSDLGGDTVWSVELDLTWVGSLAQCVGVITPGSLTQSWLVDFAPDSGALTVSCAGGAPLAGDGTLLTLQFLLGPNSGGTTLVLASALMNEGDPVPTRVNGYLTVSPVPTIDVWPDTGLLAVGQTLVFNTNGGTAPYTYTSSNPAVADFGGTDTLTGLAPGHVQVNSLDDNGLSNTTTGSIEVRAFTLDLMEVTATEGDIVWVMVSIGDTGPYGIVSGEFQVQWSAAYADFVGLETVASLVDGAGWSMLTHEPAPGTLNVVGSGSTALGGAGILCFLKFQATRSIPLNLNEGLFNEIYPAVTLPGYITINALPVISVYPATAALVVGDQQLFTVGGSPTPPFTWHVDDPTVATIDPDGRLTAVGEGVVRVRVQDSGGSEAWSGDITVCGLALPPLVSSIDALETVQVPIWLDRDVDGLDLYSYELSVSYNPASVEFLGPVETGTLSNPWGAALAVDHGGSVSVFHAGPVALTGCGPELIYLEFRGLPGLGSPYTGVALQSALFNEGTPCVRTNYGVPCTISGVTETPLAGLRLWPNHPNPFNPRTTLDFTVARSGPAQVLIYSARGTLVRRLVDGHFDAGVRHSASWDGRDSAGLTVASGVYYYRLVASGQTRIQKMLLLK